MNKEELETDIHMLLGAESLELRKVNVSVSLNGHRDEVEYVVNLSGNLGSYHAKQLAQEAIKGNAVLGRLFQKSQIHIKNDIAVRWK